MKKGGREDGAEKEEVMERWRKGGKGREKWN